MNTPPLDSKNLEILTYLSQGLTVKEIALKVFISHQGIYWRLDKMKTEAGCKTNEQLIFLYVERIKQTG